MQFQKMPQKIRFNNLLVSNTCEQDVDRLILYSINREKRLLVATPNLHFYSTLNKNPSKIKLMNNFDLLIPDGWPISLALSLRLRQRKYRIAGSDLFMRVLNEANEHNYNMKIIGGRESLASRIMHFEQKYRNINVYIPKDTFILKNEIDQISDFLSEGKRKKLLVICLGFPKQEELALFLRDSFKHPILCLGASLDFVLGAQRRAPSIFQKFGLEWLWRLIFSPKRLWRRYLQEDFPALVSLMKSAVWN